MKKIDKSKFVCSSVLALALIAIPSVSRALGTAEERAACTPDVFKLCSSEIPNVTKIIACLQAKRSQLSPGCRTAFTPSKTTTTASAKTRTRSLASPESTWCDFHGVAHDANQQDWLKWCGDGARQ